MNKYYFENKVTEKLKSSLNEWKKRDLNRWTFMRFRADNSWIKNQFDSELNNFYDNELNNAVYNLTLSKALEEEIILFSWTELNGFLGLTRDFAYIQKRLFELQAPIYLRLNYYQFLIINEMLEPQLIFSDFITTWESLIIKKAFEYRLAKLQDMRAKYLKRIFNSIKILEKYGTLLKTTYNFFGRFWTFEEKDIKKLNFSVLDKYAHYLQEDPAVMQIARLLGRLSGVSKLIEERVYDRIVIRERWEPVGRYKEEIVGVTSSNDLERVLPQEIALFNNPSLRPIFLKKFIEGELSSLDFSSDERVPYPTISQEIVQIPVPEEKGPFIIAIDTSSSMQGIPETVAKALSLAIIKIALREHRPCYLINFSTTFEVYDFTDSGRSVIDFINLLSYRFQSNTNIEPVLQEAIKVMDYNQYFNADLIILSDLAAPNITKQTIAQIEALKVRRNRFHAITIGQIANASIADIFTNNWLYDPRHPFTAENIIKTLEQQFISSYKSVDIQKLFANKLPSTSTEPQGERE